MTHTVYPRKYAHGFCFAVLCCGYTLTDLPTSIRLTSLALWQSNDGPSASKATLINMDKYFMWIHYERLHNHNKAKHNKTVCIFLGIYCRFLDQDGYDTNGACLRPSTPVTTFIRTSGICRFNLGFPDLQISFSDLKTMAWCMDCNHSDGLFDLFLSTCSLDIGCLLVPQFLFRNQSNVIFGQD